VGLRPLRPLVTVLGLRPSKFKYETQSEEILSNFRMSSPCANCEGSGLNHTSFRETVSLHSILSSLKKNKHSNREPSICNHLGAIYLTCFACVTVSYAENFRGEANFRHNRVTSQINFRGSAEDMTILEGSEACPRENFAKLHLKIRIFVHSGSQF